MELGRNLRRARKMMRLSLLGLDVLRHTDSLSRVSVRGFVEFARGWRGRRLGLQQLIHWFACNAPDRPALVFEDVRLSYGELDARINRVAHGLAALGVRPGDRVAVMLENCNEYIEVQHAMFHLGATTVQVGYRLKSGEVRYILENSGSKVLFHGAHEAAAVKEALGDLTIVPVAVRTDPLAGVPFARSYQALVEGRDGTRPPSSASSGASASAGSGGLMVYTSGTTGRPKGAHRDAATTGLEPALSFMRQIPLRSDERHLCACPLYHSAGPAFVELTYAVGGAVVLMRHFDPEEALGLIEREAITSSMLVPTMLARLVALPAEIFRRYDLSSLRWLISGAAPLPTELARRVEERFGPILYNFYGATETGFVTIALPGEHTARPGTIGRAVAGADIRLLDEQGQPVPVGAVGELWVRSPMLVRGYHGDEAATAAARRGGYFSVGDLARRDEDGYYYLADRKNDMVISGGVNIYPLEIEERLHAHPAVHDVAVVGEPSPEWGESLCAFVVLNAGRQATPEELRTWVAGTLADYKKPRKVVFMDALPRTPTGKVLKRELRAQAGGATDGSVLADGPGTR